MTYCQYSGIGNKARIMAPNVCVSSYHSNIPLGFFFYCWIPRKKMSCQINRKCNNLPYYLLPGAVVEFFIEGYKIVTHSRIKTRLQGPPPHIDAFQTNIFSWFNDTVIQSQWFLGLWDREIWYKTLFFHFINLTWPPRPQKEKI